MFLFRKFATIPCLLTVAAVALAVLSNGGFGLTAEAATTQSKITLVVPQGSFVDP